MNKRVVEHKIKLEKSVKVILGVLALGVLLNAFAPVFDVRNAYAELFHDKYGGDGRFYKESILKVELTNSWENNTPVEVKCFSGCN